MNLTAGVLLRWPSYPKNDGSKALGADVCESRANSQSRTGCLSFCAGLSRLKRPIKSNTCDVPRYFLTGTRTNSCPPLLRTLLECCKHRTQGTTARRCAQKLFCCLRWQLWQKTKADGCKRHPTHPRALPGNRYYGGYQGFSLPPSSQSYICVVPSVSAEVCGGLALLCVVHCCCCVMVPGSRAHVHGEGART